MKHFTVAQHEHVQVWTISNPPMNYMTAPMSQELLELIGLAENDANTRAIVLTGGVDGKFITHYSVDELAAMADDSRGVRADFSRRVGWVSSHARPHHVDAQGGHRGD